MLLSALTSNILINLRDCYEIEVTNKPKEFKFIAELHDNLLLQILVKIDYKSIDLLPDVYELSFSFVDEFDGGDGWTIQILNHSKFFSTIFSCGLNFLLDNKDKYLSVSGPTPSWVYICHRILQNNFERLNRSFQILGVRGYVRRIGTLIDTQEDVTEYVIFPEDVYPVPKIVIKDEPILRYNPYDYFIFKLKK